MSRCRAGAELEQSRCRAGTLQVAGAGQVCRADAEQVQRCRYGDAEVVVHWWWCRGGADQVQFICRAGSEVHDMQRFRGVGGAEAQTSGRWQMTLICCQLSVRGSELTRGNQVMLHLQEEGGEKKYDRREF